MTTGSFDDIAARGLVLLGCGKMGTAMLDGWLAAGLPATSVWAIDPMPSSEIRELAARGLNLNTELPASPAVCVLAVKPQLMDDALVAVAGLGGGATLIVSIAAGSPIALFERVFGRQTPIVRAMPNTPAAIGKGISGIIGNDSCGTTDLETAEHLLSAVGSVVRLENEAQIDAVTAVSGSGPAYVFHMIECLSAAAEAEGLPADLAEKLARATIEGAGALAAASDESAKQLRVNVTSPGGTTAAGLGCLMDDERGLAPLMRRTVSAAAARGRELAAE